MRDTVCLFLIDSIFRLAQTHANAFWRTERNISRAEEGSLNINKMVSGSLNSSAKPIRLKILANQLKVERFMLDQKQTKTASS